MHRNATKSISCGLCRKIFVHEAWIRERREYFVNYRTILCPECLILTGDLGSPSRGDRPPLRAGARDLPPELNGLA